ncbi:hypothetical protein KCP77_03075 [Salmonella enterica subsp. enterica]|nr:hypothetical protein KCP77_03075 [Salmonella enterica subsp. enterica]
MRIGTGIAARPAIDRVTVGTSPTRSPDLCRPTTVQFCGLRPLPSLFQRFLLRQTVIFELRSISSIVDTAPLAGGK